MPDRGRDRAAVDGRHALDVRAAGSAPPGSRPTRTWRSPACSRRTTRRRCPARCRSCRTTVVGPVPRSAAYPVPPVTTLRSAYVTWSAIVRASSTCSPGGLECFWIGVAVRAVTSQHRRGAVAACRARRTSRRRSSSPAGSRRRCPSVIEQNGGQLGLGCRAGAAISTTVAAGRLERGDELRVDRVHRVRGGRRTA